MTANGPLLELRHITQSYRSGKREFTAVEDVNLRVEEGEFVALVGPSGCGKSTLLRILTGLQRPTRGQVFYRGREQHGVNPQATIVFQTFALFPWMTVLGNVEVALKARGLPPKLRHPRALDLLDRVGLDGFEMAYPRELSGGMRQKVGFARALAVEPELLCLDEPFSALDVLSAEALRGELIELWKSGTLPIRAVLMVTHNIEEAVFMADRIVIMEKDPGRVVAERAVGLSHPRQRKSPEFLRLIDEVYGVLAGQTRPESQEVGTAPGEPGRTRALPHVTIGDLAGLLEHLLEMPDGRADIFRMAELLPVDSDNLLRVTEAAELLGLATIATGDIALTPLGEAFAEASILARKEIFATRIRRLPLFQWVVNMLRNANQQQLHVGVIRTALELEFPPEEASHQVEIIVDWARYAELLAYDDDTETLYLELPPVSAETGLPAPTAG